MEEALALRKLIRDIREGYTGVYDSYCTVRVFTVSENSYPLSFEPENIEFDIYKGFEHIGFAIGQNIFGLTREFRRKLDSIEVLRRL